MGRVVVFVAFGATLLFSAPLLLEAHHDALAASDEYQDESAFAEVSTTSPAFATTTREFDLPILVYHIVRPSYPSDSKAVKELAVTPELFDAQLSYLGQRGYTVVRYSDLEAHVAAGTPLPPKPIIISFDDGWRDQYEYAFPILKKHNYPATFFVFTNKIDKKDFLTWDELREMLDSGMTIAAHTRSHPYLTHIRDEAALWDEIYGSKITLERHLGVPVHEFAYPFGQFNATTTELVKRAGFKSARGDFYTGMQSADRLFELSAMNAPTTLAAFTRAF